MYDVYKKMMENFQTPSDTFLTQFGPPELMYMTGDRISPKQLDSLSDDFTGLCKDGLMNEPDNAFAGEVENFTVSGDNPQVTEKFTLPKSSGEIDTDIKHQLMKEIRQFGRKYEKIFKLLEGVKGPLEVRRQYIEFTIKEAASTDKIETDFYDPCNDVGLMAYLSTITKPCNTMNQFVNKFGALYNPQGTGRQMQGLF
ncbi:Protein DDX26B [Tupaia chinensis]|uniref:Protein DDX26B n=1 Tax=Tupaia chinensis TaxID=246437 RepID=L9JD88_TUPCH|nr:Protein DDX26B [Tupaia chinensis]